MKKMAICLVGFIILILGVTPQVHADRLYLTFKNSCSIPIGISVHVGLGCKNHFSGPILPGATWQCNTACSHARVDVYSATHSESRHLTRCEVTNTAPEKKHSWIGIRMVGTQGAQRKNVEIVGGTPPSPNNTKCQVR